ncbi:MAG: PAS domain S-box protein [Ignavibacteriae bacterium]|nr:PAS domain S-box protein [Ignavibacteriota bacterium]
MIDSKFSFNPDKLTHFNKSSSGKLPWMLISVFILLSLVVWYLGTLYYHSQRDRIKTEKQSELSAIANLKAVEIITWQKERLNDGDLISQNPLILDEIIKILNGKSKGSKENVELWLNKMLELYDYESVVLLDKNSKPVFFLPGNFKLNSLPENIAENYINGKSVLTDFRIIDSVSGKTGLYLIVPLVEKLKSENSVYGFLVFEINPNKFLFPTLQSWPTASTSSETILIKKVGNQSVYLNDLRNEKNTSLKLKEPVEDTNLITSFAVNGGTGIYEGTDFRKTEVLSFIKPILIHGWIMIVKVDKNEIYSGIKERAGLITVLIFVIILLQGILLLALWRHQKFKYYKTQYAYQLQREALTKHFNYMIKYASDAIMLVNMDGKIIEVNEKAKSLYGYTEQEFLNMYGYNLRSKESLKNYTEDIDEIIKTGEKVLEIEHVKKNGISFTIENSVRIIEIEGVKYFQSIIRDITERKEAEKKIVESESELRALFASMKDVIIVLDNESRIVKIGPTNVDLLYKSPEELIGKKLYDTIPQKQAELFQSYFDIVFKSRKTINVEYSLSVKGRIKWFEASLSPLADEKVILVARDVTERKIKERKIEQLTKIYRVLSNVNHAIVRFRNSEDLFNEVCRVIVEDGKYKMAWIGLVNETSGNLEIKSKFGSKTDYIDHLSFNANSNDNIVGPVIITLKSGKNSICNNIDLEYKIPDPPWRKLALENGLNSLAAFAIRSLGKPFGVLAIYSGEVDTFKYNEIQLFDELASNLNYALEFFEKEELIRKLSSGIQHSFISIAITDMSGIIEFVNPKFTESCGYSVEELIGKDIRKLRPPDMWEEEDDRLWEILREKGEWSGEVPIQKKTGEIYWEFAVMSPIKNDKGETTHLLSVKEDITKRKQTEEELRIAKERAEEASRLKSNFLANMSHELRTPMTGILGFAELMHNELLEPELKEMAGMILKGGLRLTDTLNSILDLSSIEANKINIKIQKKNIIELIKDSIKLFELSANQKGVFVKFLPDKDTPKTRIDERLFIQVLNNLINNAIKFTEAGEIKVLCGRHHSDDGDYTFVKVKDTGIGILPKDIERIFEPFRQVSEGLDRKYEGTGLGLTISKKFVELMGGVLTVESKISKGSVFTVLLPADESENGNGCIEKTLTVERSRIFESIPNILHVEDDMLGRKVVKVLLKKDCNVTSLEDGESALQLAKREKFDLVLMDINLRGISGIETAQAMRTIPGYENIPIVAVTAYAMVGDKEEFIRNGCTHYLSKPFTKENLIKVIQEAIEK